MKTFFITYGDDKFKVSLSRIVRQARKVGLFDRIITFSQKDLPDYIRSSPLFAFKTGGGCWCWKPYILYQTLSRCEENDIVIYADAGCSLVKESPEWNVLLQQIESCSAIFFQYRNGFDYGWASKCKRPENNSIAIKHWMKPSVADYFLQYMNPEFLDYGKIWAGFMIFRKTSSFSTILEQWFQITLLHPELVVHPFGAELSHLPGSFNAHRYDQSILTPLVYHYKDSDGALVLPETAESRLGQPAVIASRWRQAKMSWKQWLKYRAWCFIHGDV